MFEFTKIGVYEKSNRYKDPAFIKITNIGNEPLYFIDPELIEDQFKKVNVVVIVDRDGFVFLDDGALPHVVVSELDLNNTYGVQSNDAIMKEAATRAAFNAGSTVKRNSLRLVGKTEGDEVYYFYTCLSGKIIKDDVRTKHFASLTNEEFLGQCSASDFY